jgi:hypothetical protein
VTTVDVRITGPASSGTLRLHNGLFGPATSAPHALSAKFQDGTLTGPWNVAEIRATVLGSVVREVLAAVAEADRAFSDDEARAQFVAFRAAIENGAEYDVFALEV